MYMLKSPVATLCDPVQVIWIVCPAVMHCKKYLAFSSLQHLLDLDVDVRDSCLLS